MAILYSCSKTFSILVQALFQRAVRGALRAVDIPTRYGGDEFVVVMPQTDITGAATFGERLRLEVEQGLPFTISVGVASANEADTPESIFKRTDAALYSAKNSGRNCMFCDHGEASGAVLQEVVAE
jgi:diguanylate cyclase (GGDEF)-like protein